MVAADMPGLVNTSFSINGGPIPPVLFGGQGTTTNADGSISLLWNPGCTAAPGAYTILVEAPDSTNPFTKVAALDGAQSTVVQASATIVLSPNAPLWPTPSPAPALTLTGLPAGVVPYTQTLFLPSAMLNRAGFD
jgi:hypothetical protein